MTDSFSHATDFNVEETFAQFDSSLGTLNSVTLAIGAFTYSASGTVHNASDRLQTLSIDPESQITVVPVGGAPIAINSSLADLLIPIFGTLSGGATTPVSGSATGGGSSQTLTTNLGGFEGTGQFSLGVSSETFITGVGGDISANITGTDSGAISVTYNYTAPIAGGVPEASTWAMMLLGFAGIGFAGYRQTRAARIA